MKDNHPSLALAEVDVALQTALPVTDSQGAIANSIQRLAGYLALPLVGGVISKVIADLLMVREEQIKSEKTDEVAKQEISLSYDDIGKSVKLRNGRTVKISGFDKSRSNYPVLLIEDSGKWFSVTSGGKFATGCDGSEDVVEVLENDPTAAEFVAVPTGAGGGEYVITSKDIGNSVVLRSGQAGKIYSCLEDDTYSIELDENSNGHTQDGVYYIGGESPEDIIKVIVPVENITVAGDGGYTLSSSDVGRWCLLRNGLRRRIDAFHEKLEYPVWVSAGSLKATKTAEGNARNRNYDIIATLKSGDSK